MAPVRSCPCDCFMLPGLTLAESHHCQQYANACEPGETLQGPSESRMLYGLFQTVATAIGVQIPAALMRSRLVSFSYPRTPHLQKAATADSKQKACDSCDALSPVSVPRLLTTKSIGPLGPTHLLGLTSLLSAATAMLFLILNDWLCIQQEAGPYCVSCDICLPSSDVQVA